MAEAYRVRQIGRVCEFTMDDIANMSVEELIDQGHRFIIVDQKEDEEGGVPNED